MAQAATNSTPRIRKPSDTERWVIVAMVALMAVLGFWLASNRTLDPGYIQPNEAFNTDFFRQQAISMLDGRLDVPYVASEWNECWFRDDRCFGYFGVAPSVIRLAGFAVTLSTATNPSPVIIAAGVAASVWAAISLALGVAGARPPDRRPTAVTRLWLIVVVGALLGPGSILTFLSQAKIYYEAIVLMIAGLGVAVAFTQRWLTDRKPVHLWVVLAGAVVAANSRPTAILTTFIVGLAIIAVGATDTSKDGRRSVLLGAAVTTVPLVTSMGITWLKLRTLTPSFSSYVHYNSPRMVAIRDANDETLQGLRFIPNNLVNFLRPDALSFGGPWPGVRHAVPLEKDPIYVPPITPDGLYAEFTASVSTTMPVVMVLAIGFFVAAVAGLTHMTKGEKRSYLLLVAATAPLIGPAVGTFAVTSRYLGDFYPVLAVGTVFALVWLLGALEAKPQVQRVVAIGFVSSAVVTYWINQALQQQSFTISG